MQTILIVEPSPMISDLLQMQLTLAGYRVFSVATAEDALVALVCLDVDLVTLEVRLPDISGTAFVYLLEQCQRRTMPIVVLSTTKQEAIGEMEVEGYLRKPYRLAELMDMVHSLMPVPQLV